MNSAAIKKSWETRRAKYGTAGRQNPSARPSDKITDEQYREKIRANVKVTESGCWEWQGWRHPKGYGEMSYRCKNWRLHRLSYVLWRGPIPDGLVVCHTCDNRPCCNPLHLFLGTFDTNNKDMAAKGRCKYSEAVWPTCKHGHPFTPENTYRCSRGFRHCKTCDRLRMQSPKYREYSRQYQRRRREAKRAARLQSSESEKP